MKALSIRAPWWWHICNGHKDIENRGRPTKYRGPVLIHASKWWKRSEVMDDAGTAINIAIDQGKHQHHQWTGTTYEEMRDLGGHIVGQVEIVDCIDHSDNPWFFGPYGFVLANPVRFWDVVPCKGALGFFPVPADVLAQIENSRKTSYDRTA